MPLRASLVRSVAAVSQTPTRNCMQISACWNRDAIYDCGVLGFRAALGVSWSRRRLFAETPMSFASRRIRVSSCFALLTQ